MEEVNFFHKVHGNSTVLYILESVIDSPLKKSNTISQNHFSVLEKKCLEGFRNTIYLIWSTTYMLICLTEKSVLPKTNTFFNIL